MKDESLYYDHYKETNEKQQEKVHKRDLFTVYLLCCLAFFLLVLKDPDKTTETFNKVVLNGISDFFLEFSYINTILIYVTLWIVLQYYQICLSIERGYLYISSMETKLSNDEYSITRESLSYLEKYPILSNVANFVYAWGIPIVVGILAFLKMDSLDKFMSNVLDNIGLGLIIIFSVCYFIDRNLSFSELKDEKAKWHMRILHVFTKKL